MALSSQGNAYALHAEADLDFVIAGTPDAAYTVGMRANGSLQGTAWAQASVSAGNQVRGTACLPDIGCLHGDELAPLVLTGWNLVHVALIGQVGPDSWLDLMHSWDIRITVPEGTQVLDPSGLVQVQQPAVLPEPASLALVSCGLIAAAGCPRRFRAGRRVAPAMP